jgi:hypothetical protein
MTICRELHRSQRHLSRIFTKGKVSPRCARSFVSDSRAECLLFLDGSGCSGCPCHRPPTAAQRRDSGPPSGLRPLPLPWGKAEFGTRIIDDHSEIPIHPEGHLILAGSADEPRSGVPLHLPLRGRR